MPNKGLMILAVLLSFYGCTLTPQPLTFSSPNRDGPQQVASKLPSLTIAYSSGLRAKSLETRSAMVGLANTLQVRIGEIVRETILRQAEQYYEHIAVVEQLPQAARTPQPMIEVLSLDGAIDSVDLSISGSVELIIHDLQQRVERKSIPFVGKGSFGSVLLTGSLGASGILTKAEHEAMQQLIDQLTPVLKRLYAGSASQQSAKQTAISAKPFTATEGQQPIPQAFPPASTAMIRGQHWAVIIGVGEYEDNRIPKLRYASADAMALYEWLTASDGGGYAPSMVKLLIDKDATHHNMRTALFVWLKQAIEEDMITIYFAGHGSPESPDSAENLFLLPYDVRYDNIAATGFPMWDIETALKRFIKARKVVVIADACHAGGVGQSFDIARRGDRSSFENPISSSFQNLSAIGDGICVISASGEKQLSQEGPQWGGGHGVFTYYLLAGLRGEADYNKDGRTTLGELVPFLSERVRRATVNAQSPTVSGRFDPALSIAR